MLESAEFAVKDARPRADTAPQAEDLPAVTNAGNSGVAPIVASGGHIALLLDPSRILNFHTELARRLTSLGYRISIRSAETARALPASVSLLLALERMIERPGRAVLASTSIRSGLETAVPWQNENPDAVIDLCDSPVKQSARALRVLYDGSSDEAFLFGALLAGRMPTIEVAEWTTNQPLASVVPASDNAATILDAYECVLARTLTLLISAIQGRRMVATPGVAMHRTASFQDLAKFEAKSLAHTVARRLYHLCCHAPHWRTCWRYVDGPDLWDTRTVAGTSWNIVPDPGFRFYADPFPFVHEGHTFVFVEDLDHRTNKALISVIPFDDNGPSGPARPVLEEPWHLSYPFIFPHAGEVWMIPESSANRTVSLYRADPFPHRWVHEADLLTDIEASDATMTFHGDRFWMFAATRDGAGSWSDTLSIYSAANPLGPWSGHPANPILIDQAGARPAGAFVKRNGKLWRPVQDCSNGYGTGVGLAEVLRLDQFGYEQRVRHILRPDPAWPGRRFHTLNRAGRLECIDGAAHSPRMRMLANALHGWSGRRDAPDNAANRHG